MVHFVRKILMDRIKDQNMNFYLETPSTSNNVITFTLSGYKSEQKLGTLYRTGVWMRGSLSLIKKKQMPEGKIG